ncbi:MAG TPA: hypothetical protein VHR97_05430 [Candidatus Baltobacteraceae bacterium]|nr:hypothetical protein [Candidatus Baltobacteraceae bacterium]
MNQVPTTSQRVCKGPDVAEVAFDPLEIGRLFGALRLAALAQGCAFFRPSTARYARAQDDRRFSISLNDRRFGISLNDRRFGISLKNGRFSVLLNDGRFGVSLNDRRFGVSLKNGRFSVLLQVTAAESADGIASR